jgi:hypothetical protein
MPKNRSEYLYTTGQDIYIKHTWYVMHFISFIFLTGDFLDFFQFLVFLSYSLICMKKRHMTNALHCSKRTMNRLDQLRRK